MRNTSIGIGSIIAVVISWTVNHSVLWCLIHGFFGWFYIVYYLCGWAK
jgi:hypothetical protein